VTTASSFILLSVGFFFGVGTTLLFILLTVLGTKKPDEKK
jgi:hypothetical protein